MVDSNSLHGAAGYIMEGFCLLGAGVMVGFLRALATEHTNGYRHRELVSGDDDEVGEER